MENASKALIIAGAILLSILLIGMGVYVYNMASGTMKSANMNDQEIQAYNGPFEDYGGDNVSGSQAMALCDKVKTHNLAHQTDLSKQIEVTEKAAQDKDSQTFTQSQASTATKVKQGLRSGYTYKITYGYDSMTGYVTQIGIEQNKKAGGA